MPCSNVDGSREYYAQRNKSEKDKHYMVSLTQRTARRDKKAFLSYQCEETEENSKMGDQRSRQENQRYQGNISCKDEHNKGQKWYEPNRSRRY